MKLNLPAPVVVDVRTTPIETKPAKKLYPNQTKNPRVHKSGKRMQKGFAPKEVENLNAFHEKRMAEDKITRANYEASKVTEVSTL